MKSREPIVTFRASIPVNATPEAVYDVLADVSTHLVWEGRDAREKVFRLLSLEAPSGRATVGTRFSSTGANILRSTFHDQSEVVEAVPGKVFAFETESTLRRRHAKPVLAHASHRYAIDPGPRGSTIAYTCNFRLENYVPFWFRPAMVPMTKRMVERWTRKHMANLARMAERSGERV
jgi:hypothetical protein